MSPNLYIRLSILNVCCYKVQAIKVCIKHVLVTTEAIQNHLKITKSEKSDAIKWPYLGNIWDEHRLCMLITWLFLIPWRFNDL